MSKHTRGPWTVDENEMMGRDIISVGSKAIICTQVYSPDDARLIAAAPELLLALVEILSQIDQGGSGGKVFSRDYCIKAARAAVSRAT